MTTAEPRAVILAAGAGVRMWPFGETQPKALLPVAAEPLLAATVREIAAAGVGDIRVAVGGPHARAVEGWCALAGDVVPVAAETAGTAASLLSALADDTGPCLCVYGDVWFPRGVLAELVACHREDPAAAVALLSPLGSEHPQDWICGDAGPGDLLSGFQGHPRSGGYRSGGAFVLPAGFGRFLAGNPGRGVRVPVGGMPHAEADLEESLNLFVLHGGHVRTLVRPTVDLDKPWHLLQANQDAMAERFRGIEGVQCAPGASVSPEADVRAPVILAPGAELGPGVIVRAPLLIGPGSQVTDRVIIAGPTILGRDVQVKDGAYLEEAILGDRVRIGHGAEVSGVVMDGAYIVHYCQINGVVGRAVDIGAATVCGSLRFDDGTGRQWVGERPAGRWETPAVQGNACYVGDFCRTGVNVTIMPGRSIGAFSCVGPGLVLQDDVPARTRVLLRQEVVQSPWGPERYGW